jgi:hypothetical protein
MSRYFHDLVKKIGIQEIFSKPSLQGEKGIRGLAKDKSPFKTK